MGDITFEQMPAVLSEMSDKLDRIEKMLNNFSIPALHEECFMTVTDAASLLKLSESTIYGKVCRGEIPVNKKGKRLYFEKEKLLKWVQGGRKNSLEEKIGNAEKYFGSALKRRR